MEDVQGLGQLPCHIPIELNLNPVGEWQVAWHSSYYLGVVRRLAKRFRSTLSGLKNEEAPLVPGRLPWGLRRSTGCVRAILGGVGQVLGDPTVHMDARPVVFALILGWIAGDEHLPPNLTE